MRVAEYVRAIGNGSEHMSNDVSFTFKVPDPLFAPYVSMGTELVVQDHAPVNPNPIAEFVVHVTPPISPNTCNVLYTSPL